MSTRQERVAVGLARLIGDIAIAAIDDSVAVKEQVVAIPVGNYEGWNRYDTDNEHVLSVHANDQTWDVRFPKGQQPASGSDE